MKLKCLMAGILAAPFAAAPSLASDDAVDPASYADKAWITIDGTVESVRANSFTLDYGPDAITVEMDDRDRQSDGYQLRKGDLVRVSGRVDHNLMAATTIEASSVYVENLGTHFFASSIDDEDRVLTNTWPLRVSTTTLRGRVASVGNDSFTVATPGADVRVGTGSLAYDPLDEVGYQRVEKGDRVLVTGDMDTGFFDARRGMEADRIIILRDASARTTD